MIDDFARPRHIIRLEVGRRIGNFDVTGMAIFLRSSTRLTARAAGAHRRNVTP
jgi:hypothetical protein